MKIFDLKELAASLSPKTVGKDVRRSPLAVPPRLHIAGTRLLRWRAEDVAVWLAGLAEASPAGKRGWQ